MHAVFDMELAQPSFWFTTFVAIVEHMHRARGDDNLIVQLKPGVNGPEGYGRFKHWPNTKEELDQNFNNIVYPMARMWGGDTTVIVGDVPSEPEPDYVLGAQFPFNSYVDAYAAGVRPLHPHIDGPSVIYHSKLITITLRECGTRHWINRDSKVKEWIKAAHQLRKDGWRVVFIRDTRFWGVQIEDFETSYDASLNLYVRAALYKSAVCNCFVNNGPAWMALLLNAPVLMFRPTCDTAGKTHSTISMGRYGVVKDQQLPNHSPHHRLVWKDDTCHNILQGVNEFLAKS